MLLIGSRPVPKSTAHIVPVKFFTRSTRRSFRKGEVRMESSWLCTSQLLSSQERDHRITHENLGHSFDATFTGPGA
jgi:hypothetical protein